MTRIILLVSFTLVLLSVLTATSTPIVVIDPGHGGPGGSKYGENGDGKGSEGQNGLTEEWVNLQVATKVRDSINSGWSLANGILTRESDTIFVDLTKRVQIAKDSLADYFISIHHNGDSSSYVQGTEVWWSSRDSAYWPQVWEPSDSVTARSFESQDSLYALKTLLKIQEEFEDLERYRNRCQAKDSSSLILGCDEVYYGQLYVLNHTTHSYCALSEASFLTDPVEEALFANESDPHADDEAHAIFTATRSHYNNNGIAEISNRYIGGPGYIVGVDGVEWGTPTVFVWEPYEYHVLLADDAFYHSGYTYWFHHWAHSQCHSCSPDWELFTREISFTVPYEIFGFHIYRAYFTGGPYWGEIEYLPNPEGKYAAGEVIPIYWDVDAGVDSTTVVNLYLDRNDGNDGYPELLAQNIAFRDSSLFTWTVTGPDADFCRLKISAIDAAENECDGYSQSDDVFSVCSWLVGDADGNGQYSIGDATYIISFIFDGGSDPIPHPVGSGDVDGSGGVSIGDSVYMINYIMGGGPEPGRGRDCADY